MKKNNILIILLATILVALFLLVIYGYPRKVDVQSIIGDVSLDSNMISVKLDYIYSSEKYFDYDVAFKEGILSITVRKSNLIGKSWPQTIVIQNKYPDFKVIEIVGTKDAKIIFPVTN
jgi:hypothetical protein